MILGKKWIVFLLPPYKLESYFGGSFFLPKGMVCMAKFWAKKFYQSEAWKATRESVFIDKAGICERCKGINGPGEIVHHKIWLTSKNINDVNITLNKNNLELLCRVCHALEHEGKESTVQGLRFNERGELVSYENQNFD